MPLPVHEMSPASLLRASAKLFAPDPLWSRDKAHLFNEGIEIEVKWWEGERVWLRPEIEKGR